MIQTTPSNRNKHLPIALLIAVLATSAAGCDSLRHRQLLKQTEFQPQEFVVDVPVQVRKGLFVASGQLGDGTEVALMVDTGAFESKLTASTATAAGIEPLLHRDNSDTFGRSQSVPVGQLPDLQLGGLSIQKLSAGLLDWPDSAITPCLASDGLLGANALRGLSWHVDFNDPRLTLASHADKLDIPATASSIAVDMPSLSATPQLSVRVNDHLIKDMLLDLGSNGGLVLPRKYLSKLGIAESEQTVIDDAASSGIYGAARQHSVRAPVRLQMGQLPAIEVMAEFSDDSGAKLGTAVLSHFRLWLDHEREQLSLERAEPASRFADEPLPHGVLLGVDWATDRWQVSYLEYPAGDNAPAGLAVGDEFATVNELRPSDVFSGWCDYVDGVRDWLAAQDALVLTDSERGDERRVHRSPLR